MTKDELKRIINKHVGYAEAEIYDAIDQYEDGFRKEIQKLRLENIMLHDQINGMYEDLAGEDI